MRVFVGIAVMLLWGSDSVLAASSDSPAIQAARDLLEQGRYEECNEVLGRALSADKATSVSQRRAALDLLPNHISRAPPDARAPAIDALLALSDRQRAEEDIAGAKYLRNRAAQLSLKFGDLEAAANAYGNIGSMYYDLKQPDEAYRHFDKARTLHKKLKSARGEAIDLQFMAGVRHEQGKKQQAVALYEQALELARKHQDRATEAGVWLNIGRMRFDEVESVGALEAWSKTAEIGAELGDLQYEAMAFHNIANVYTGSLRDWNALARTVIAFRDRIHAVGNPRVEYRLVGRLCDAYGALQRLSMSGVCREEQVALARELDDPEELVGTLADAGRFLDNIGQPRRSLSFQEEALALARQLEDQALEAQALRNLGHAYTALGRYRTALQYLSDAMAIDAKLGNRQGEADDLNHLAVVHSLMGKPYVALDHIDRALTLHETLEDKVGFAQDLIDKAHIYLRFREPRGSDAMDVLMKFVDVNRTLGHQWLEAKSRLLLGTAGMLHVGTMPVFAEPTRYKIQQAIDSYIELNDQRGQAQAFCTMGSLAALSKIGVASSYLGMCLAMSEGLDAVDIRWQANFGLMGHFKNIDKATAAIFFGKRALNDLQAIRLGTAAMTGAAKESALSTEQRDIYLQLAELLLENGRVPEAIQALRLLKEAEFSEFSGGAELSAPEHAGMTFSIDERLWQGKLLDVQAALRSFGAAYAQQSKLPELGTELEDEQDDAIYVRGQALLVNDLIDQIGTGLQQRPPTFDAEGTAELAEFGKQLATMDSSAAAAHFLLTRTSLHVIVTVGSESRSVRSKVDGEKLALDVEAFRKALRNKSDEYLDHAQELYDVIVRPASALFPPDAPLLISPDLKLRNLPIAALHDGRRFFAEAHPIAIIVRDIDKIDPRVRRTSETAVAFGLTSEMAGYRLLRGAGAEADALVKRDAADVKGIYAGQIYLDQEFTSKVLASTLEQGFDVVHVASHFVLSPGSERDSYLLLGTGDRLSLESFRSADFNLRKTDIVTFSACESGLDTVDVHGQEAEGLARIALDQGARTIVATLWPISDLSAPGLTEVFYLSRHAGASKARALQRAQIATLKSINSHPYFWAPYTLYGDWR
jgi:CHAT domain-containing protein